LLRDEIASGHEKHKELMSKMDGLHTSLNKANDELKCVKAKAQESLDKVTEAEKNLIKKEADLAAARKEAEMERERRKKAEDDSCTIL
jgi:hypothetical protein